MTRVKEGKLEGWIDVMMMAQVAVDSKRVRVRK